MTSELMKAMADAGAPFEAILIAVQALDAKDAEILQRDKEQAEKRARDAERKRNDRAANLHNKRPRNVRGRSKDCPSDPPIEDIHTPSISPNGETLSQRDDCSEVVRLWNEMAGPIKLSVCSKLGPKRRQACQARIRSDGLEAIAQAIERIPKSAFLRGDAGSWGGANIDFLLKPDRITQILEGKYDDSTKQPAQPASNDQSPRNPYVRAVIANQAARSADERRQPDSRAERSTAAF